MAVDLTTRFCGLTFKNPVIVAAGVHGRDGKNMKEVSHSGVAAVVDEEL
jgi:dihydroorotate dehydrogenase